MIWRRRRRQHHRRRQQRMMKVPHWLDICLNFGAILHVPSSIVPKKNHRLVFKWCVNVLENTLHGVYFSLMVSITFCHALFMDASNRFHINKFVSAQWTLVASIDVRCGEWKQKKNHVHLAKWVSFRWKIIRAKCLSVFITLCDNSLNKIVYVFFSRLNFQVYCFDYGNTIWRSHELIYKKKSNRNSMNETNDFERKKIVQHVGKKCFVRLFYTVH